ncbi:MAG: ribonuclease P protein component [Firmicutes bacterium]|nr:ribonuclease P protein component [Bacillota bacterium]
MRKSYKFTLRNQKNFSAVYNRGKSKGSKYVVVLYRRNNKDVSRLAYVASKKVGNSVQRNRARRLMREAYRTMSKHIVPGYDVIFVARNSINDCKCGEVQRSMFGAIRAAGLFEDGKTCNT